MSYDDEQRSIGIKMAKAAGAKKTLAVIKDRSKGFKDILRTAVAEVPGGVDTLVTHILQAPPRWAYETLHHIPDLGSHRAALLKRAAMDSAVAFHTLRDVPNLGRHRDALLKKASEHPAWAHMTLRDVSNHGKHRDTLLQSVAKHPKSAYLTLKQVSDLGDRRKEIEDAAARYTAGRV
jgi:hypothetical protein